MLIHLKKKSADATSKNEKSSRYSRKRERVSFSEPLLPQSLTNDVYVYHTFRVGRPSNMIMVTGQGNRLLFIVPAKDLTIRNVNSSKKEEVFTVFQEKRASDYLKRRSVHGIPGRESE